MREQRYFLLPKETVPLCTTQQPWLFSSVSPYSQYKPKISCKGQLARWLIPEIFQPTRAPLTTRPCFTKQITAQQKFRPSSGMLEGQDYMSVAIAGLSKNLDCLNKVWGIWMTQKTQIKELSVTLGSCTRWVHSSPSTRAQEQPQYHTLVSQLWVGPFF